MSSALALRSPHPFPLSVPSPICRHRRRLFKPSSLLSRLSSAAGPLLPGPSLRRGLKPSPPPPPASSPASIDEASFARVFLLAALRVPADQCSALERRLRGHLLNWPRLPNVARVPGDDLDPDLRALFRDPSFNGAQRLEALAHRGAETLAGGREVLSPVLYREKLVKEFNCRGFLNFRNVAKISRPKKKKKKQNGNKEGVKEGFGERKREWKNEIYVVEVVGEEEDDDMRGLLGEEFQKGAWRGPTRLLLLDERHAYKGVEELPEAIKVVLEGDTPQSRPSMFELVQCRLTLFYKYWQMNELLEALLPEGLIVPTGFETVGHIAHLNLKDEHLPYKKLIAQVVWDKNKPKIQTVVNKMDAIQNDYRTMDLEVLAGNHSLVTTVVENGIRFQVDIAMVYWNSRLGTERQRLVNCFSISDVVCDVFAGVGPIAISAAKKVKHVYANDLNPTAVEYLERNIVLSKLERKIEVFNMDGRRFIEAIFTSRSPYQISQVVMNLPNDAAEFLDAFRGIFRKRSKDCVNLPKIHVYGFSKAQNPEFDFHERINVTLGETVIDIEMHRVRLVAPGKWMLCASFTLPHTVAFAKQSYC